MKMFMGVPAEIHDAIGRGDYHGEGAQFDVARAVAKAMTAATGWRPSNELPPESGDYVVCSPMRSGVDVGVCRWDGRNGRRPWP